MRLITTLLILLMSYQAQALDIVNYEQQQDGYASGTINIVGIDGLAGDFVVEMGTKSGRTINFNLSRINTDTVTATILNNDYIEDNDYLLVSVYAGSDQRLKMFKINGGNKRKEYIKKRKTTQNNQHPAIQSLAPGETIQIDYTPPTPSQIPVKTEHQKINRSNAQRQRPADLKYDENAIEIEITEGTTLKTIGQFVDFYTFDKGLTTIKLPGDEKLYNIKFNPSSAPVTLEDLYAASNYQIRHIIIDTNSRLFRLVPKQQASYNSQSANTRQESKATPKPPLSTTINEASKSQYRTVKEAITPILIRNNYQLVKMPGDDALLSIQLEKNINNLNDLYKATSGKIKHVVIQNNRVRIIGG